MGKNNRLSFRKIDPVLQAPNLLDVQKQSYDWLTGVNDKNNSGIAQVFKEIGEIQNPQKDMSLSFGKITFEKPKNDIETCRKQDLTYAQTLYVEAAFTNYNTGEIKNQTISLGELPKMTPNGTFIINGIERVVVSQIVRSPGVYFEKTTSPLGDYEIFTVKIIPSRGAMLEFEIDKNGVLSARLDRKRKQSATVFLKAIDIDVDEIKKHFKNYPMVFESLEKDTLITKEDALIDIFKKNRPGDPVSVEAGAILVYNYFFNSRRYDLQPVGRYKVNKKLGVNVEKRVLTKKDIVETIKYLISLYNGKKEKKSLDGINVLIDTDDIDNLANRRIRTSGELIQNQLRIGLSRIERNIRERMTLQDADVITPNSLINAKPLVAIFKEFFGLSQLSQFMQQNNSLDAISHKRRISALGVGGLSRERADVEVRDVHFSHYGRLCPIESPEGGNIGLISALSTFAKVNAFGLIETPYRIVKNSVATNKVDYLTADNERGEVIAQFNSQLDSKGKFINKKVLARTDNGENESVNASEVTYMDVSPEQVVSVGTSMIPFLDHDDGQRALMGANMQRQAVPLIKPDKPLVGTGVEFRTALDSFDTLIATENGTVVELDASHIVVKNSEGKNKTYTIKKFDRTNQSTSFNQRVAVNLGDKIKEGEILANGPSVDDGDFSMGANLLTAFMSWEGHNYEDAIILSERIVRDDTLTSIHIEEYEVDAKDTKLGTEIIKKDIPNTMFDATSNLDDDGIIRIGAEVGPGDILVGKVTPKGETQLTTEERLVRAIFEEKNKEYRDSSLKVPHGEQGIVVGIQVTNEDDKNVELPTGVHKKVKVFVAQKRKITEGDKLAGRHGNKGVIARILPIEDMPFLEDGTPIDIVLNPLGVPRRMNIGQILELHLGWIASQGWKIDSKTAAWAKNLSQKCKEADPWTPVAVPVFNSLSTEEVSGLMNSVKANDRGNKLVGADGKAQLYHGRSGKPFTKKCAVGYMYILKLSHMVDDKVHARSTGPYSIVTQQPLGGKAQFGGQRFGEMEVWALEAYGASYTLQELLTMKSDDVSGRLKVYEAIVRGENVPKAGIPESFKVLIKELQSLCMDVNALDKDDNVLQITDESEETERTEEKIGISIAARNLQD